ncbi:MAG TPA: hypothetical protein VL084_03325 [Thermoanaerobaculia bacterium]|nr:hypothetical protein [Thermoanaerobaculia bacterium]
MGRSKRKAHRQTASPTAVVEATGGSPLADALWGLAAGLTFLSFGYTIMQGADLWWHLAAGRWLMSHGLFSLNDPFSFTRAGQPWLHHEALSDLVFHLWGTALGIRSLVIWKWMVVVAVFLILFYLLRRLAGNGPAYLSSLLAAAVAAPFLDIRPHLYSLLGFVLLLRLTLVSRKSWLLPLLFLVWVNLHGGFFFGLITLPILLLPSALSGGSPPASPDPKRRAALVVLACALVCLLNPNGLEAFLYPLKYAFDTSSPFRLLGEWRPPFEPGGIQAPLYPWAIALFAGAAVHALASRRYRRDGGLSLVGIVLSGLTLAMSLKSRRFIPLFAISQTLVVAPSLADLLAALARRFRPVLDRVGIGKVLERRILGEKAGSLLAPLLALFLGAAHLARYPLSASTAFHYLTVEDSYPIDTVDFMEANGLTGNVLAYYDWGGYLNFRGAGRLKVFIDGRADTVYDSSTYLDYLRIKYEQGDWIGVVERSGADFLLWPRTRPGVIEGLARTGRWRPLYKDSVSALLVRAERPMPSPLKPPPDSAYHELTLAEDAVSRNQFPDAEAHLRRSLAETPYLASACYRLAVVQAWQGRVEAGRLTADGCNRIFPYPERLRGFAASVQRAQPPPP